MGTPKRRWFPAGTFRFSGALGDRDFVLLIVGYGVSLFGSGMVPVALTFAILDQGHGATGVGLTLAAETAAMIVLLLIGGAVADRFPRRSVMILADAVRCIAQAALAILLVAGHLPLWLFMAVGVVLGAGQAFFGPALTGLVPDTTAAAHLQGANALIGIAKSAGQVLGPALAGMLVAAGGASLAIGIDALTYAVGAVCLSALRLPNRKAAVPEPFLRHLRLGWSAFTAEGWLPVIVTQFAFFRMLVVAPVMVLGALVAEERLGGATAWGLTLSGEGVGAVLGGLLVLRTRPLYPLVWATLGPLSILPLIALLTLVGPLWAIVPAAALWGAGLAVFSVLFETTLQQRVPVEALSRVSAYDWLGSYALAPLGFALAGPLATSIGVAPTLGLSGLWLAATSGLVLAFPAVRNLRSERRISA